MKKRVLINNDNGRRDLLGLRLLDEALKRKRFQTEFCNRNNIKAKLRTFKPHALIAARGDNPIVRQASKACKVYIVPGEGGRQTKETMLSVFMGRGYTKLDDVDWISRCYLWNENTRKWLLETDLFDEKQLVVVGNPRIDIYRHVDLLKSSVEKNRKDFRIGVAFSATTTSTYFGEQHFAEVYHDTVHRDFKFPIVGPGRHFEDIIWRDHAILRRMIHVIKDYMNADLGKMWLRPNPLEGIKEYHFLEKRYPGRATVKTNQSLPEFLSGIDVLLTCWSTTGIEALMLGVPVISINGLIDQERLYDHVSPVASGFETFVPFYHLPKTEAELLDLLRQAKDGQLAPSQKSKEEVAALLKNNYNWPSKQQTVDLIASDLLFDLNSVDESTNDVWRSALPIKKGMPPFLYSVMIEIRSLITAIKSGDYKSYLAFLNSKDPQVESLLKRILNF